MKNNIEIYHNVLNELYTNAEEMLGKVRLTYTKATLNSYQGHYIKINGGYEYQKYYMPVISVEEMGDICFNLDGISLEFFRSKLALLEKCDFDMLLNSNYDIEIYDGVSSTKDIYYKGMSLSEFITNLKSFNTDLIGITINCQTKSDSEVIDIFKNVSFILEKN